MLVRLDLNELRDELDAEAEQLVFELANELVNQLKIEAPSGATGDLRRSFQIFRKGDGVVWLGTRIPYALFVQEGTGPIDNPPPPFEPFQIWARRKLGDESAAGGVWHKVRTEGIDANPYMDRAIQNAIDRVT